MPTFADVAQFLGGQTFGSTFVPESDLSGKTIVITGANTGLGLEAAKHLARLGTSRLILGCRNTAKGEAARTAILDAVAAATASDSSAETVVVVVVEVWPLDLASDASVAAFASRLGDPAELPRLDAFIANAGVELDRYEAAPADEAASAALELTLKVNVISTFLLAIAALPRLRETAEKGVGEGEEGTTTNTTTTLSIVGSLNHCFAPDAQLDFAASSSSSSSSPQDGSHSDGIENDIFARLSDPATADMANRYPLSKLMGHLCARELAGRVSELYGYGYPSSSRVSDGRGGGGGGGGGMVVVNCVSPGWCATELSRSKDMGAGERFMARFLQRTAEQGARTLVHAVVGDGAGAGRQSHGRYLSECAVKPQSAWVESEEGKEVGKRVWGDTVRRIIGVWPEAGRILQIG